MAIVWLPPQLAIVIRFPSSKLPCIQIGVTVIIKNYEKRDENLGNGVVQTCVDQLKRFIHFCVK